MIGNNQEPGISSTVTSASTLSAADSSPGTPLFVGGADLSNGSASPNTVYSVGDISRARTLFGESHLTRVVGDALGAGALPVLAVAPSETEKSESFDSLSSQTGELSEPAKVAMDDFTVTVDSSDKTTKVSFTDYSSATVESGNVLYNTATDEFKLDNAPSLSASVNYTALDYQSALDVVAAYDDEEGYDIDFVSVLTEHDAVLTKLHDALSQMKSKERLALGVIGATPSTAVEDITVDFDDSRIHAVSPLWMENGESMAGAYVGLRAALGLTTTPIGQKIRLRSPPARDYTLPERGTLIDGNITPLEAQGYSARVADDLTTVSEENSEEQNMKYGFSRLVVDFLLDTVHELESPYVGKFNSPGAIGQLEDLLNKEARPLKESAVIYDYDVSVELVDPTSARVIFQSDVAEPIRNIKNDFVIGNDLSIQNEA